MTDNDSIWITIQDIWDAAEDSIKANGERCKKGISMQIRKPDTVAYLEKIGVGLDGKRV